MWKKQEEHLKDRYRLIIPDLPGSGASDMIDDMSMEGMAEVLKQILDKENEEQVSSTDEFKKVVMIGHSMGGYITLAFAEKYMDHLSAFGLFHSSSYADNEEKKVNRQKGIDFIKKNGAPAFLKTVIPNLFSAETKENDPGLLEEQLRGLDNFSGPANVSYYEAMMARPDRTQVLKNSVVPVLFIMGKYDTAVPVEHSLEQSHLPDNAYIHILRHSAHMGMLEEVKASNMALDKFLL